MFLYILSSDQDEEKTSNEKNPPQTKKKKIETNKRDEINLESKNLKYVPDLMYPFYSKFYNWHP